MQLSDVLFGIILKVLGVKRRPSPPTPGSERRTYPRVPVGANLSLLPAGGAGEAIPVLVRDLSAGGICVLHPSGLPKGQHFILQVPVPGAGPASLTCHVVRSRPTPDGKVEIGAEIIELQNADGLLRVE